jgi:hypothetical protein
MASNGVDPPQPSEPPVRLTLPPTSRPLDLLPPRLNSQHGQSAPTFEPSAPDDLPQSQPMTASHSTSSQNPDADNDESNAAGPYGTRSRNRGPRINYADDKELDQEIEAAGRMPKTSSRKSAAASAPAASSSNGFSAVNSANAVNDDSGFHGASANAVATVAAPAPSKKRKQPGGGSAAASGSSTPFALGPRRAPAQSAHYVVSNLLSFTKCSGRLNSKKQLVADDGTTLQANGMLHFHPSSTSLTIYQTLSTPYANHLANPTTLLVSWNSSTRTTILKRPSTQFESIGFTDPGTLLDEFKIQD